MNSPLFPWLSLAGGSLLYSAIIVFLATRLSRATLDTPGFARKVFHVGIFTGAVPAQLLLGFWGVVLYGSLVAAMVLTALWRGRAAILFRVLAREEDGEEKGRLILVPLLATALGGMVGVTLVGDYAVVGYLVCGWGDAGGEIVGRRWGTHEYSSPFSPGRGPTRTLEGSLAVLLLGFLGAWAALGLLSCTMLESVGVGLLCGLIGAVAEGLSTPGTDNFWLQLIPTLTAWWILG